jgi:hypothetical protein
LNKLKYAYAITILFVCLRFPPFPPVNFWMPEAILMKLCTYIMTPGPIWTAYFINPTHQSVCLYVCHSYRYQAKAR